MTIDIKAAMTRSADKWPVYGKLTEAEFNRKWSGRHIAWGLVPGYEKRLEPEEAIATFGNDWEHPSDYDDLAVAGEIALKKDGSFSRLLKFGPTTGLLDPRSTEEHLAVFDRFLVTDDVRILCNGRHVLVCNAEGETYLTYGSPTDNLTSVTAVKADDTHLQTILIETLPTLLKYEWNGREFTLADRQEAITHENLAWLKDLCSAWHKKGADRNILNLVSKFIAEGCPDYGNWVGWIKEVGPFRPWAYRALPRRSMALKADVDPHEVLERRFLDFKLRHSLDRRELDEIERVMRILRGEALFADGMGFD